MREAAQPATKEPGGVRLRRLFTEGVILTLVPVVAYSLAFKYEQGICEYYGLPSEVIELSLWSVIGISLGVLGALFSVLLLLNVVGIFVLTIPLARHALGLHPNIRFKWAMLTVIVIPYLYVGDWKMRIGLLVVAAFFAAIDFLIPILARGDQDCLAAINKAEEQDIHAWTRPLEFLPRQLFWLPVALLVTWNALSVASVAGEGSARTASVYACVEVNSSQYAILRIYDNVAYCGEVDEATSRLTGQYAAVSVAGQEWSERRIGPLERPESPKRE